MPGTSEGAKKAVKKLLERDPNYFSNIGKRGGTADHKSPRGFAAMPRELVSAYGTKGGAISRRKPRNANSQTVPHVSQEDREPSE